jgi:hypothetical protein
MRFSRTLALILGLALPVAETIRRWSTWQEQPARLFDDYLLGAFLLLGVWLVGRNFRAGQLVLAAAWGFFCGLAYCSFFGQLEYLSSGQPDPSGVASEFVVAIKGMGLGLGIVALVLTVLGREKKGVPVT